MKGKPVRKSALQIRLAVDELEAIRGRAAKNGLSLSAYCRVVLLREPLFAQAAYEVSHVRNPVSGDTEMQVSKLCCCRHPFTQHAPGGRCLAKGCECRAYKEA